METENFYRKDYSEYSVRDFLSDDDFLCWVRGKGDNKDLDLKWDEISKQFPEKLAEIKKAAELVSLLSNIETTTNTERKEKVWHSVQKGTFESAPLRVINISRGLIRKYSKIAAILLFSLLISGWLIYNFLVNDTERLTGRDATMTIYAPLGARVAFCLPDSTSGMLNSGSRLTYKIPFTKNRKITLDGEAWLKVKHDVKCPFEISAGASKVRVLGTSLNVSAYPSENYVEVVLQKGKVEFCDDKKSHKVDMLPSERLVYHDGIIEKSVVDPSKFNAWTEGKLVFRGDLMAEVVRRIERWYNVKIVLADKQLENYSFRATFMDDSLEDVLHYLSLTSPITYTISPREQLKDGTFSKELVTIHLK